MDDSSEDNLNNLAAFLSNSFLPGADEEPTDNTLLDGCSTQSDELSVNTPITHRSGRNVQTRRFHSDFHDRYQEFFRRAFSTSLATDEFETSHFGASTWSSSEKAIFFQTLASKGRHDFSTMCSAIATKSETEVRSYLLELRRSVINRQRFSEHAKAVGFADIDAAVEIGPELEADLESAADHLALLQEKYDMNECKIRNSKLGMWLITSDVANDLDSQAQARCEAEAEVEDQGNQTVPDHMFDLFHLTELLSMSRNVFMNVSSSDEGSHWKDLATEQASEPEMTVDALRDIYNLVKGQVQRVVQTAMFLAQSRLRSSATADYEPAAILKDIDITAALDVLGLPHDAFDYWANVPSRCGLKIFLGAHDQGKSNSKFLNGEEIRNVLSVRGARGRRRSMSSMLSRSSQEASDTDGDGVDTDIEGTVNKQSSKTSTRETDSEFEQSDAGSSTFDDGSSPSSVILDEKPQITGRKLQSIIDEQAEDEFLEAMDHCASVEEEISIRRLLGLEAQQDVETSPLRRRPRKRRKTEADLVDWTDSVLRKPWHAAGSFDGDL